VSLTQIALVEPAAWVLFALAGIGATARMLRREARGEIAFLGAVMLAAAALRLVVPFGPTNWYTGVANIGLDEVYTRTTTYMPWISRVVTFDLGVVGIRALNLLLGCLSVFYLWYTARVSGHSRRACRVFAVLLAITPVFVRFSASDASHTVAVFLYACAAAAFVECRRDHESVAAHLLLFTAVVLGMPIRLESSILFVTVPCFLWRANTGWRDLLGGKWATATLLAGATIGLAETLTFHAQSLVDRGHADMFGAALMIASRLLVVVNPHPVAFFPPVLALPIWVHVAGCVKRRQWGELASLYVPIGLCGIPFAFSGGVFLDLPSAGYQIIAVVFILLACGRGVDALADRVMAWGPIRLTVASVVVVAAVASFVPGFFRTYAFQEEFRFLRDALPREAATVLVIWDPETHAGDLDCCLSLPYPTLIAETPSLRWTVLRRDDVDEERIRRLEFDYYYPGAMVSLDLASLDSRYAKLVRPSSADRERQRDHVRALQKVDEQIHRHHRLELVANKTVAAHTFSSVAFREDSVTLSLYRRSR
jgi:hypothetical protein